MKIKTIVETSVSAAHIGPFAAKVHGHTWTIRAAFLSRSADPDNALDFRTALEDAVADFDHGLIDDVLGRERATDEGMAEAIFLRLAPRLCVRVEVWRAGERIGAEAEA